MSDISNNFSIPSQGTEEQKRQTLRDAVQDKQKRIEIDAMIAFRDKQIEREKEKQTQERKCETDKRIADKVGPKHEMHLKPKGVGGMPPEEQQKLIRAKVALDMKAKQADELATVRRNLNANIDREIKTALSAPAARQAVGVSSERVRATKRTEFKRQEMRENSRDIGEAINRSRELGRKI